MLLNSVQPLSSTGVRSVIDDRDLPHPVDARDVGEIATVLMSLKQEMPAIIVARRGATGFESRIRYVFHPARCDCIVQVAASS